MPLLDSTKANHYFKWKEYSGTHALQELKMMGMSWLSPSSSMKLIAILLDLIVPCLVVCLRVEYYETRWYMEANCLSHRYYKTLMCMLLIMSTS
jgi:hypothetical protein